MKLYLGIDGGQSHTTALIADVRGRILGKGSAGPSNHTREPGGRERLIGAVNGSVGNAAAMAGLNPSRLRFAAAHLALTGEPEEKIDIVREIVRAGHLEVGHDAPGALAGALAGATGIIVLAGTGSVACGEALVDTAGDGIVSRRFVRVGGHGYLFSDEGSAFAIAREALRHALRNEDAGEDDDLKPLLLGYFGNKSLKSIAQDCYAGDLTRERLASFASVLGRHAARHAGAAREILDQAAGELATLAALTARRLEVDAGPLKISYGGGVFRNRRLLKIFEREVTKTLAHAIVTPPRFGPDIGALLLAYRGAGIRVTQTMFERIEETIVQL